MGTCWRLAPAPASTSPTTPQPSADWSSPSRTPACGRASSARWGRSSDVTVIDATAESLPLPDRAFDVVVSTLVLCSVDSPGRSLAEVWRVLGPGGRLLFLEHVAAEGRPGRLRWQRLLEPAWRCMAGNCHLTRRTEDAIAEMGFQLEDVQPRVHPQGGRGGAALQSGASRGGPERPRTAGLLTGGRPVRILFGP